MLRSAYYLLYCLLLRRGVGRTRPFGWGPGEPDSLGGGRVGPALCDLQRGGEAWLERDLGVGVGREKRARKGAGKGARKKVCDTSQKHAAHMGIEPPTLGP